LGHFWPIYSKSTSAPLSSSPVHSSSLKFSGRSPFHPALLQPNPSALSTVDPVRSGPAARPAEAHLSPGPWPWRARPGVMHRPPPPWRARPGHLGARAPIKVTHPSYPRTLVAPRSTRAAAGHGVAPLAGAPPSPDSSSSSILGGSRRHHQLRQEEVHTRRIFSSLGIHQGAAASVHPSRLLLSPAAGRNPAFPLLSSASEHSLGLYCFSSAPCTRHPSSPSPGRPAI
jgi:hypothetical protein